MSFRVFSLCAALVAALPSAVAAQSPEADSVYAHARELVAAGKGAAGRGLVDSMLVSAPEGTADYAEALYWHAALAPTSVEAEPDFRRIIVEYPLARRAGDALLALSQIELARGDRAGAQAHLERFLLENPDRPERGRAGFLLTRVLADANNEPRACAVLARTIGAVPADSVELRNQFDFFARRCEGVDTTQVVEPAPELPRRAARDDAATTSAQRDVSREAPASRRAAVKAESTKTETRRTEARSTEARKTAARKTAPKTDTVVIANADSNGVIIAPHSLPVAPEPVVAPPRDTVIPVNPPEAKKPKAVESKPTASRERARPRERVKPAESGRYAVQVAAYATRGAAEALVRKLAKRDIEARVVGDSKPFRVRIGHYATRGEAQTHAKALGARGIHGFITESGTDDR